MLDVCLSGRDAGDLATLGKARALQQAREQLTGLLLPPAPVMAHVIAPVFERGTQVLLGKEGVEGTLGLDTALALVATTDEGHGPLAQETGALASRGKAPHQIDRREGQPLLGDVIREGTHVIGARERQEPPEELRMA